MSCFEKGGVRRIDLVQFFCLCILLRYEHSWGEFGTQSQASLAYFSLKVTLRWRWRAVTDCLHFPNWISLWKAGDEEDQERWGIEADNPFCLFSVKDNNPCTHPGSYILLCTYCIYHPYDQESTMYAFNLLWTFAKSWILDLSVLLEQHPKPPERSTLYSCPKGWGKNLTRQACSSFWETSFLAQVRRPSEKSLDQTEAQWKPLLKG